MDVTLEKGPAHEMNGEKTTMGRSAQMKGERRTGKNACPTFFTYTFVYTGHGSDLAEHLMSLHHLRFAYT
jgi:hypothetical protein